jgi:hypothetical protein
MQPLVGSAVNDVRRLVSLVDSGDGDFELRGQSLCQGLFHDPTQATKPVQVICHLIVFDKPSVLRLVTRHDRVCCLCFEFRSVYWLSVLEVAFTFLRQNIIRDA